MSVDSNWFCTVSFGLDTMRLTKPIEHWPLTGTVVLTGTARR